MPAKTKLQPTADNLRPHLEPMQRTLNLAVGALDGPDPWAALGYLERLCDRIKKTRASFHLKPQGV